MTERDKLDPPKPHPAVEKKGTTVAAGATAGAAVGAAQGALLGGAPGAAVGAVGGAVLGGAAAAGASDAIRDVNRAGYEPEAEGEAKPAQARQRQG